MADMTSRNALLAREIRAECARQQISGRELSRRSGVPERTVARYLRGETSMSLDDIEAFAAALGMPTVDLVTRAYYGVHPFVPGEPNSGNANRPAPDPDEGRWAPRGSNPEPTDYAVRSWGVFVHARAAA